MVKPDIVRAYIDKDGFIYGDFGQESLDVSGIVLSSGTVISGSLEHSSTIGLSTDDHPQYGLIAGDETVSGDWDFSNSLTISGSSPMLVSPDPIYGEIYQDGITPPATTVSGVNYVRMVAATISGAMTSEFSMPASGVLGYSGPTQPFVLRCAFSPTIGAGASTITFRIAVNQQTIPSTETDRTLIFGLDTGMVIAQGVSNLSSGDQIEICASGTTPSQVTVQQINLMANALR